MNAHHPLARTAYLIPVMALAFSVQATDLLTVPLSTYFAPSSVDVKPNILFILDDSGSMSMTGMPDQATWFDNTYGYRDEFMPTNYNGSVDGGMPPYMRYNAGFNGIAYNPAVRYQPPLKYLANNTLDTTTYPSMTAANTANWTAVKNNPYIGTGTSNLSGGVFAYVTVPGEWCDKPDLRTCNTTYSDTKYPATIRWCTSATLTTCRATWDGTWNGTRWTGGYGYPRMPAPRIVNLTVSGSSGDITVSGITVGTKQIMSASTGAQSSNNAAATAIAAQINACSNTLPTGTACSNTPGNIAIGFTATVNGAVVTIYAPDANTATPTVAVSTSTGGNRTVTVAGPVSGTAFGQSTVPLPYWRNGTSASSGVIPGENLRHTITSSITSYTKYPNRSDCTTNTNDCTYTEEMTNYANWHAYYRTRMQMTKTAASRAFGAMDKPEDLAAGVSRFRVGLTTINNNGGNKFLNLGEFTGQQRADWFTMLFSATPSDSTPLRTALSRAGQLYAGKLTTLNDVDVTDPLQYSCQQNFSILFTDGFWNSGGGLKLNGSTMDNQDGAMPPPYNDGGIAKTQQSTSSLQSRTETQSAEKGTLQSATGQLQTRTSQLQKRTNPLEYRESNNSGSTWGSWTPVPAGSTCTWDTQGPSRRQCRYVGWSTYANESTSCTPNALDTSTSNNSVWEVGVECQYNPSTWTAWVNTGSCSAAPKDTSGTWSTPVARECQTVTGTYADAATCSPTTPDASGQLTVCSYNWATSAPTQTCEPAYIANDYSNQFVYRNCAVSPTGTTGWVNATTCTATDWTAAGTRTACQYTAWSPFTDVANCTEVGQLTGPDYTVATARACQTVTASGGNSNTLADVAAYYYNHDLRLYPTEPKDAADATGTCTGPNNVDLCKNDVPGYDRDVASWQHMTTFTLGLGAQGKMLFSPTYWTDPEGDFTSIATQATADPNNGVCSWISSGNTCVWPTPSSDNPANIDDLWHAAV